MSSLEGRNWLRYLAVRISFAMYQTDTTCHSADKIC